MGEEEVSTEFIGNSLVLGKFSAVVSRQRMHAGQKGRQQGDHGIRNSLCGLERDVGELVITLPNGETGKPQKSLEPTPIQLALAGPSLACHAGIG